MSIEKQQLRDKLVPRARKMRREPSDGERRLWSRLRNGQLQGWKFRRQHPAGPFIADFACVDAMLIVEVDGGQHNDQIGRHYDESRDAKLRSLGWRVVRFWADAVLRDTDLVIASILENLPSPPPSPGVPVEGAEAAVVAD